ncbi:MAG: phosphoribosylanthranilate isomerase [Bacteroidales bacterium]|nr:phosphoribosylanthranilate isomerase [Bacteroidales bacterium]
MQRLKIKVCGMTEPRNMQEVCNYGPDYIGYIFYDKSVRYVGDHPDPELFRHVPEGTKKTAVFVNEYYERMVELTGRYGIDVVQLHGMESPQTCSALRMHGKTVIKVFPGDQMDNQALLQDYLGVADFFLFDTPVISHGGSGRKFDWSGLDHLVTDADFFLSGGITIDDAEQVKALKIPGLYAVDINSRFETEPGIKDPALVGEFIKQMKDEKK